MCSLSLRTAALEVEERKSDFVDMACNNEYIWPITQIRQVMEYRTKPLISLKFVIRPFGPIFRLVFSPPQIAINTDYASVYLYRFPNPTDTGQWPGKFKKIKLSIFNQKCGKFEDRNFLHMNSPTFYRITKDILIPYLKSPMCKSNFNYTVDVYYGKTKPPI